MFPPPHPDPLMGGHCTWSMRGAATSFSTILVFLANSFVHFILRYETSSRKSEMNCQNQASTPLVWEIAKLPKFLVTL